MSAPPARISSLREKIKEAQIDQTRFIIMVFVGVGLVLLGSFWPVGIGPSDLPFVLRIYGLLFIVLGGLVALYYQNLRGFLKQEIKDLLGLVSKCPKCGKEIPQGDLVVCPFCNSPLHSPS